MATRKSRERSIETQRRCDFDVCVVEHLVQEKDGTLHRRQPFQQQQERHGDGLVHLKDL
jgi:hypothetical protein